VSTFHFHVEAGADALAQAARAVAGTAVKIETIRREGRFGLYVTLHTGEALPERAARAPVSWSRGDTTCETAVAGRPCRAFAGPCPKRAR